MKYLFIAAAIVSIACSANAAAECRDDESKIVKECYLKFIKAINVANAHHVGALNIGDDCEIYSVHQKCLQNGPKCFFDSSDKEMTKIFYSNRTEISKMLLTEYSFKHFCDQDITGLSTKEDTKCFATITAEDIDKECEKPKSCEDLKQFPVCYKKVLIHKCKNEKLSKLYADAMEYALKNILTKC